VATLCNNKLRGNKGNSSKSDKEGEDDEGNKDGNGGDEGGAATTANADKDSTQARYYMR
jgi:hypothetical protein